MNSLVAMVYSCICFSLQLPGEDTQVKQDRWEEGRRKKRLQRSGSEMQLFPGWVLLNTGSLLSEQYTSDETSSCRCCLCASACWVGWKQAEKRTDVLLSGGGFSTKRLNQGNSCLWQGMFSVTGVFTGK